MRENLHFPHLWQGIGWLMVVMVCWLSLTPNPPEPPDFLGWDKAQHSAAYAGLMYWFWQVFHRHWRWPVFLIGLGAILEFLQGLTDHRTPDPFDMAANSMGVLIGLLLAKTLVVFRVELIDHLIWRFCWKKPRTSQ